MNRRYRNHEYYTCIRKAVGAKRQHIMLQFLCELCILSILGGLIGLTLLLLCK
nr:FtsX-like permease family protein [uncultured Solibaculum sp.]